MAHGLDFSCDLPARTGQVLFLEAEAGRQRHELLDTCLQEAGSGGAKGWILSCDFQLGGPWAGVADFFLDLTSQIEPMARDLMIRHDYELVSILPVLRNRLSPRNPTLTDLASAREQVRLYPADRALRILHGLIDLLAAWKQLSAPSSPWVLACDDLDKAGHLARRFFVELMRRIGPSHGLILLAACAPGSAEGLAASFSVRTPRRIVRLELQAGPDGSPALDECARLAQEIEDRLDGDPFVMESHLPALIRLWKGSAAPERALPWQYEAFSIYTSRGFYLDSISYGEGALAHLERMYPEDESRRWKIVNKLFACHCMAGHPERAFEIVSATLDRLQKPYFRALDHYVLAMLHARYLPVRNLPLAEEHLETAVADLYRAGLPEDELQFQLVFNRNGLALIRHLQGASREAIKICHEGYETLCTHLRDDQHRLHRSVLLYNIAQVYSSLGAYEEAVHHFSAAMEMDPNYSEYYNDRGNLHFRQGRLQEALDDYLQAIEQSPPFAEVRANLGQCYFKLGRIPEALQAFSVSLDLDPEQPGLWVMRARCHEALLEQEQALAAYGEALARQPHQALILSNRACLYYELGRTSEALADLDQAISCSPQTSELFQNRAVALADLERFDDAIRDLETYLCLCPNADDLDEVSSRIDALRSQRLGASMAVS